MKFFKLILCLLIVQPMWAQSPGQNVKTAIKEVKIYMQGAEMIRTKDLNLAKGKHQLIFSGLSPKVDPRSIQVTTSDNTSLLSITSKTNFLKPQQQNPRAKVIQDSIDLLNIQKQDFANIKRAFQKEEEILQRNQDLKGKDKNLTTDELIKVANFYRERFREIYKEKTKIDRQTNKIARTINLLNRQRSQMNSGTSPTSEIYLEVKVKSPATTKIKLRYLVTGAGWSPIYDLYAGALNEPINLKYRALAYNSTGVDWNNVNIVLSTADPYQSASKPMLSPWRLNAQTLASNRFQVQQGRLNSNAQILSNTMEDISPGLARDNSSPLPTGASNIRMEQIEISELSNDFVIDEPYDLPSDQKPYSIDIKTSKLNASYRHYAVPKLDKDVFLLAQITGWEDLDLIDGPMNIYHTESYIGQANLSTRTLNDTLDLSLGRDRNVIATRVKQKELSKKKFFGSDRKVTRSYKIDIKNNHNQPINIEIQDQIPISSDKEIVVTLLDRSKAKYTENTGKLEWRFNQIPSGARRSVVFKYSIKHPKGKAIQLEKKRKQWVPRY